MENNGGKGENAHEEMFSTLSKTNFTLTVTFVLLSANALNLDWSKILLFGTESKHHFHIFFLNQIHECM